MVVGRGKLVATIASVNVCSLSQLLLSLVKQMLHHGLTGSTVMTSKFAGIILKLFYAHIGTLLCTRF